MHVLIIFDKTDSLKKSDDFDSIVSAEIPDKTKYPRLFDCVTRHMIHTHNKICLQKNICKRNFPKDFNLHTYQREDGYPVYRRRSPQQVLYIIQYVLY